MEKIKCLEFDNMGNPNFHKFHRTFQPEHFLFTITILKNQIDTFYCLSISAIFSREIFNSRLFHLCGGVRCELKSCQQSHMPRSLWHYPSVQCNFTGGGQILRIRWEVLPVADYIFAVNKCKYFPSILKQHSSREMGEIFYKWNFSMQ